MRFLPIISAVGLLAVALGAHADVYVDGYYRSDGTYVQPHVRSSPDSSISNNYGPSQTDSQRMNPYQRDYDRDGTANTFDYDSDNDGWGDDFDSNPYGN